MLSGVDVILGGLEVSPCVHVGGTTLAPAPVA